MHQKRKGEEKMKIIKTLIRGLEFVVMMILCIMVSVAQSVYQVFEMKRIEKRRKAIESR